MDSDLEALKRQRDLVAQHLNWLDGEIARRSLSPSSGESASHPENAAPDSTPVEEIAVRPPVVSRSSPHPGLARRQQLGCVALAVLLAAGIIFVFWFLPGWIYD